MNCVLYTSEWDHAKHGGRDTPKEQISLAGCSLMSLCFLPSCLDCCLTWHNLFRSHSPCYVVASDIPGQDSHLVFWGKEFTLHGSFYQLQANCVYCSPNYFLHLPPLFLFVSQCSSYFSTNEKVLGQEHFLVMEHHRDFCQLSPSIEVKISYGQRIFNCGTGSNNIKRCYLFSSLSLQQMWAMFKVMPGFKM